jgi:hypothetical protein
LPLELLLNGVEPLALGVERAPGVVVNQPQVPRAVADELPPAERPSDPAVVRQAAAKVRIEILGAPGALPA